MSRPYLFLIITTLCYSVGLGQKEAPNGLIDLSDQFSLDIRYATTDNFTGQVLYPCQKCLLKELAANALLQADQHFKTMGYRIRIFDCYRPLDIQKLMWKVYPNPSYVANPYTKGSIHNRGYAVDLSLETLEGELLDMGTDYDHFGPEAHWDSEGLTKEQKRNREILREGLMQFGFQPIRTEWWHYSYKKNSGDALNTPLPCTN